MAPVPVPEEEAKGPPSGWAILGTALNTLFKTRVIAMKGVAFAELWRAFMASLKIRASKAKALAKVKELERQAAEEDAAALAKSDRRRRRDVHWEMDYATY